MGEITLKGSGDFSQLHAAYAKQQAMLEKLEAKLKNVSAETKKASKEEAALAREAKRVFDETRTPQERFIQKKEQLNRLLEKGKIEWGTYRRAVHQAHAEMNSATGSAEKGTLAATAWGLAGKAAATVFAGGLAEVKRLMDQVDQKYKEAAERNKGAFFGLGSLMQLAHTPEEAKKLRGQAVDFYAKGGGENLDQAARMVFQIYSAQQQENLPFLREAMASGMIQQPGEVAASAVALQTTLGKKRTGDIRALMSRGLAASEVAPATMEEILRAAAGAGGAAGMAGVDVNELLASVAWASKGAQSAEMGGTVVNRLLTAFAEYGRMSDKEAKKKGIKPETLKMLQSGTLAQRLSTIESMGGLKLEQFKDIAGEIRAVKAYTTLTQNLAAMEQTSRAVAAAPSQDVAGQRMQFGKGDLVVTGQRLERETKARREVGELEHGAWMQLSDALRNDMEARMRASGASEFKIGMMKRVESIAEWGTNREGWVRENLDMANPDTRRKILYLRPRWGMQRKDGGGQVSGAESDFAGPAFAQLASGGRTVDLTGRKEVSADFFRAMSEQTEVLKDIREETKRTNQRRVPAGAGAGMFSEPKG